jgi:putative FmdB family regulatory protein
MPTYEYLCEACNFEFEELLLSKQDIKDHQKKHPCPECGEMAPRVPSASNFTFKSNTYGNSGSHDLDYPTLDKAIGRSANRKWKKINKEQEARNKVRLETRSNALAGTGSDVRPLTKEQLSIREKALKTYKDVKKQAEKNK